MAAEMESGRRIHHPCMPATLPRPPPCLQLMLPVGVHTLVDEKEAHLRVMMRMQASVAREMHRDSPRVQRWRAEVAPSLLRLLRCRAWEMASTIS